MKIVLAILMLVGSMEAHSQEMNADSSDTSVGTKIRNKKNGEIIELRKLPNEKFQYFDTFLGGSEPLSNEMTVEELINTLENVKQKLNPEYIPIFGVTENVWQDGYLHDDEREGSPTGRRCFAMFLIPPFTPAGVVLLAGPTLVDLAKAPVVGTINAVKMINQNNKKRRIESLLNETTQNKGQLVEISSKRFKWLKDALTN